MWGRRAELRAPIGSQAVGRVSPRRQTEVGVGEAERSYPASEVRGHGREELPHAPTPKARGGGREEQPHVQRAVAARAQEGLEKLSYVENQEGWR